MRINPLYKTTNDYDKIVPVGDLRQHRLNAWGECFFES